MGNFVHLHVHSEYSPLDGMGTTLEMVLKAKEMGQTALALTDHGSMSGLYEFQKNCIAHGIKPILGCEFYIQTNKEGKSSAHLIVLAKNDKGYENMCLLHEASYTNFYKKPRITFSDLEKYHEGLIVTTACIGSEFGINIMNHDIVEAKRLLRKYKDLFGDDFYIELQPNEIPIQYYVNDELWKLAEELQIKTILTNDVHYVDENDWFAHEVMLGLQTNKKYSDEKRMKFSTHDFWLRSAYEMKTSLDKMNQGFMFEESARNTLEIAQKCSALIVKGNHMPKYYDIPKDSTERELLVKNIVSGATNKGRIKNKKYMVDVQHEVNVIDGNGYSGYFLIVEDYIKSARNNDVFVGQGRGSVGGSKVAYLLDITSLDPEEYGLLFERFLAENREPDIDVDFSNQEAVFKDLQSKYGENNVAKIIAFGKMTPRACCRKVLSFFEIDKDVINQISKLIPDLCKSMKDAYDYSPVLLSYKELYPREFTIIEKLENRISHESQHAGGVVICSDLPKLLPLKTKSEDRDIRVCAYDKYMLEELGFFKFDILGLETLPIIYNTLKHIENSTGRHIDLKNIPLDDKEVYDMLCAGDVSGVFQLSNQAQKVVQQKPSCFRDLIAINALVRPGVGDWGEYIARRNGKEWIVHEKRMPYMAETEGVLTYQEQFMLDCKVFAGWNLAFADKHVRKNKDIRSDHVLKNKFITDVTNNGYTLEFAQQLWQEIEDAVDGGLNDGSLKIPLIHGTSIDLDNHERSLNGYLY